MNASDPVISICVANFNGALIIERCIRSLLTQEISEGFEVLVYDDASTDGSDELVATQFPQVTLVRGTTNRGFCHASNQLAAIARGTYLLFINNDAYLEQGALALLWQQAGRTPADILTLRQLDPQTHRELDLGMGLDLLTVPFPLHEEDSRHLVTCIGACLWVSRETFRKADGFPEWFGSIAEDLFLCLFARLQGHKVQVLTEKVYFHDSGYSFGGGASDQPGRSTTYRRRHLSERNRFFVFLIFYPLAAVALLTPAWVISWLLESIALGVRHRSIEPFRKIYWAAIRDVFAMRRLVLAERRRVQAARQVSFSEFLRPFSWVPSKLRFLLKYGLPELR